MTINLTKLNYTFKTKPLLIGGKAKEYYGIRKAGTDIDFVVTKEDYDGLATLYPHNTEDLYGDLGIKALGFELWTSIRLFTYDFLSEKALEKESYKIISLEKLLFLTAIAVELPKYEQDLRLIVKKINALQYKKYDQTATI